MTADEPDLIVRHNLDDHHDEELPSRAYWWSLHRPETYAIAALVVAGASLISFGPANEIAQSILFGVNGRSGQETFLLTLSGIRLGVALIAIFGAVLSIRSEDEETTWSAPVARAAILVSLLAAVFSAASMIVVAATSTTDPNEFGG